eukprot:107531_1
MFASATMDSIVYKEWIRKCKEAKTTRKYMIDGMKNAYKHYNWPWIKSTALDNFVDNELTAMRKGKPLVVNHNEVVYKQKYDAQILLKQNKPTAYIAKFLKAKYGAYNKIKLSSFTKCVNRIKAELQTNQFKNSSNTKGENDNNTQSFIRKL